MNKKSQMQSQIFIYIMVLIIGAGILIYGYNAVKGFKTQADDVLYMQFENKLRHDFKSISYESVKTPPYELPSKISEVCFKAEDAGYSDVMLENTKMHLIATAIEPKTGAGTDNNVFLYPKGERAFFAGIEITLEEEPDPLSQTGELLFKCFDVKSGMLKIRIKGKGSSVLVTEP